MKKLTIVTVAIFIGSAGLAPAFAGPPPFEKNCPGWHSDLGWYISNILIGFGVPDLRGYFAANCTLGPPS